MRFFAEAGNIDEENRRILLFGEDVNHIRNVLRMKEGDEIWVSDGAQYEYHCRICDEEPERGHTPEDRAAEKPARDRVTLEILYRQEPDYELPGKIILFQGLPKGDKMDFIIQKAVELGVSAVVPVSMKRCVMKLDQKRGEKKTARWQQIAESASKQSRRLVIPKIYPVTTFAESLRIGSSLDILLAPYELAHGMEETRKILSAIRPGQSVGIFIGPEGGFEKSEIRAAMDSGAVPITLGHRILRTETAGMTLLSVLMFQLETD